MRTPNASSPTPAGTTSDSSSDGPSLIARPESLRGEPGRRVNLYLRGGATPLTPARAATFVDALRRKPLGLYLYGPERWANNLALYGLAEEVNPEFVWLDIRDPTTLPGPSEPVARGWVRPERVHVAPEPASMRPGDALLTESVWRVLLPEGSPGPEHRLGGLMRLSRVSREALGAATAGRPPAVVACSNSDVVTALYPAPPEQFRPFLQLLFDQSVSLFVAHTGPRGTNADAFDVVLRVEATDRARWRTAALVREDGPRSGPARAGLRLPFAEIAAIANAGGSTEPPTTAAGASGSTTR